MIGTGNPETAGKHWSASILQNTGEGTPRFEDMGQLTSPDLFHNVALVCASTGREFLLNGSEHIFNRNDAIGVHLGEGRMLKIALQPTQAKDPYNLPPSIDRPTTILTQVYTEHQVAMRVQHPHLRHVHGIYSLSADSINAKGYVNIAIETDFIKGSSMLDVLDRIVDLEESGDPDSIKLATKARRNMAGSMHTGLQALSAMHAKGILHRDLKPSNFMLNEDDAEEIFVKPAETTLIDTGAAVDLEVVDTAGESGTPAYSDGYPVNFSPKRKFGIANDTYSVGVMYRQILGGSVDFISLSQSMADRFGLTDMDANAISRLLGVATHIDYDTRIGSPLILSAIMNEIVKTEQPERQRLAASLARYATEYRLYSEVTETIDKETGQRHPVALDYYPPNHREELLTQLRDNQEIARDYLIHAGIADLDDDNQDLDFALTLIREIEKTPDEKQAELIDGVAVEVPKLPMDYVVRKRLAENRQRISNTSRIDKERRRLTLRKVNHMVAAMLRLTGEIFM